MGTVSRFRKLSYGNLHLLSEAVFWVGVIRFIVYFFPFRTLTLLIGRPVKVGEGCTTTSLSLQGTGKKVAWSVRAVSRRVPWESQCLVQAASARMMLSRRGMPSTLYLGVRRESPQEGGMKPHAWLATGSSVILGGGELDSYVAVSSFK